MRKICSLVLATLMSVALLTTTTGCNTAWYQQFKANPIAGLQDVMGYLRTALGLARGAFEIYASTQPSGIDATRARFESITGTVEHGMLTAQDGLRLAANVRQAEPDVDALTSDARSAMLNLHAFLQGLPGVGTGQASSPVMRDALAATQAAARPRN